MELPLFEQVGELVRALVPVELGVVRHRSHGRGVKVWLDDEKAPRLHYEAQLLPRRLVDDVEGVAVEVGFHAEDRDPGVNEDALARLEAEAPRWRPELGPTATPGPFLGRPDDWRRLSETWVDPDLDDPELAFELAARLADYITHLHPLLPDT